MTLSFVSIIIPCRNEERFIEKCLDSLIKQDFPKENLEILVVDGNSKDKTKDIIKEYIQKYPFIRIIDNKEKYTPFGLNMGIKKAKGDIIVRMDAHAKYGNDYISKCVKYLKEYNADNVGGVLRTIPSNNSPIAKAIAICLSHFFGAGNSYFRTGSKKPIEVDTVFGGCYRKEVFNKIGLFNEKLIRSQDIELNRRLKASGGKILLVPDITAYYYPQSNLADFFEHNFIDGVWTTYPLKFGIRIFSLRHLIPLFFVLSLFLFLIFSLFFPITILLFDLIFGIYIILSLFFSIKISIKNGFKYFFLIPIVFLSRHIGYGLGSIWGLIK